MSWLIFQCENEKCNKLYQLKSSRNTTAIFTSQYCNKCGGKLKYINERRFSSGFSKLILLNSETKFHYKLTCNNGRTSILVQRFRNMNDLSDYLNKLSIQTFYYKSSLSYQITLVFRKIPEYVCKVCKSKFDVRSEMLKHRYDRHGIYI